MNRIIRFSSVLALLAVVSISVAGQKKYNDLAINNLYGPVKKVEAQRTVYEKECGYNNCTLVMCFAPDGYTLKKNDYIYSYGPDHEKYMAEQNNNTNEEGYECYRLNIETGNHFRKDSGVSTKEKDLKSDLWLESWLSYEFDTNGRLCRYLSGIISGMQLSMWDEPCFDRAYEYKGASTVPYRVKEELDLGGNGWTQTLLYKYEGIDVKGNWTKRKAYLEENGKLLMDESRVIEYYNPGEVETFARTGRYKL